ncbi:MAG: SDR family NAD(P)-dependent oxidoreductase [Butyribacter sp.]|nr:SDR family NAD(P)-dependent oxidoreductase [bacterium]MDY3854766.1 SDR family NAD(P)-dependent oxidoreductase [Butyribacter sp.]
MAEKKKIAIVTGAGSGLGKEFVSLLCKEKDVDEIWAVARNQEKLEKLRTICDKQLRVFSVDLTDRMALTEFGEKVQQADVSITYLVNNAGYGKFCSYDDVTVTDSVNMIDLNVSAVVAMGLYCIPKMEKGSHMINIASQSAFQPLPYLNIYSATKAFVRNYSRALRVELKEKQITVTAVCPGWLKTPFMERADVGAEKTVRHYMGITTPDNVAKKALKDAKKGKDISVYGIYTKMAHTVAKILPQRMMMKIWLWQQNM